MKTFEFCPFDGQKLAEKEIAGRVRKTCEACGYINFENAHVGAAVVIENKMGEILLVKRRKEPAKDEWDLPGGFAEGDEHPQDAAIREAKEELGLDVKIEGLIEIGLGVYDDPKQGFFHTVNIGYLAKVVGGDLKVADDASGYQFFKKENLPKVFSEGDQQIIEQYLRDSLK